MNTPESLHESRPSPLQQLKDCFDSIRITYKEHKNNGYTYISMCSPSDVSNPFNPSSDAFIEFDENEQIASY